MRYRKKPIEVEAFRYNGDLKYSNGEYSIPQWAIEAFEEKIMYHDTIEAASLKLYIVTLEGVMCADVGDYIIQGVNGELYPCKSDIFEKTYDEVYSM